MLRSFYIPPTPHFVTRLFPQLVWHYPTKERVLYLTFDDGPTPIVTDWVLEQLRIYHARATFFCIGKNALHYPDILDRIRAEGHVIGNHTQNHLNAWKVSNSRYINDIVECAEHLQSPLFRPPYGKITPTIVQQIQQNPHLLLPNTTDINAAQKSLRIVMWHIISGDFDTTLSPQKCLDNVIIPAKSGSVIVFHDSQKAFERLRYALPLLLQHFAARGYTFRACS